MRIKIPTTEYISIHLMLLFIGCRSFLTPDRFTFQYISCYCLSRRFLMRRKANANFNTSHVTVYPRNYFSAICFKRHFNTSHVTVYRLIPVRTVIIVAFQYISCYCLSEPVRSQDMNCVFQYISCYCLSASMLQNISQTAISIHLMLLFIRISFHLFPVFLYFNTSHVTVYRPENLSFTLSTKFQYISCYCLSLCDVAHIITGRISIHLMLLFIKNLEGFGGVLAEFQYISCYCLSQRKIYKVFTKWISIHLMLLFICVWYYRFESN